MSHNPSSSPKKLPWWVRFWHSVLNFWHQTPIVRWLVYGILAGGVVAIGVLTVVKLVIPLLTTLKGG